MNKYLKANLVFILCFAIGAAAGIGVEIVTNTALIFFAIGGFAGIGMGFFLARRIAA